MKKLRTGLSLGRFGGAAGLGGAAAVLIGVVAWTAWPASWPAKHAELAEPTLVFDEGFGTKRIYLDAGHGAEDNVGNRGALGQLEQNFTLSLAEDVAVILEATGHFEVRVSRKQGELVAYADRVAAADTWPADVFVSLHSDVRSPEGIGYSILWSDEGTAALTSRRVAFARAMAEQLGALGLPAYGGSEYAGLYAGDRVAGVFVDRHLQHQRIFVLRRPAMPSIIVETHNAKSVQEAQRWDEPKVRRAFAVALGLAVARL